MKLSNLYGMEKEKEAKNDDETDSESESSSDEEEENEKKPANGKKREKLPILHAASIEHSGNVNRIKAAKLGVSSVAAVWNDIGKVQLWNLTEGVRVVDQMEGESKNQKLGKQVPIYSFEHRGEGYGLGWSPLTTGMLASGDHKHKVSIHILGNTFNKTISDLYSYNGGRRDLEDQCNSIRRSSRFRRRSSMVPH